MLGPQLTALDIYLATFLTQLWPLADADCPQMTPLVRPAFAYLVEQISAAIPPALIERGLTSTGYQPSEQRPMTA